MRTSVAFVLLLVSVCLGFAQGKIGFQNNSTHLVYFTPEPSRLGLGDAAVAGRGLYDTTIGLLTGSPTLVVDLWAGTVASSLSKQRTTTFGADQGRWTPQNVILPAPTFFPGVMAYFQIQVHDSRDFDAQASCAAGHYYGTSPVFTAVPQVSIYAPIANPPDVVPYSTWAPGTFPIVDMPLGNLGAIEVVVVPEPGTLALAALGATLLMSARRRSSSGLRCAGTGA